MVLVDANRKSLSKKGLALRLRHYLDIALLKPLSNHALMIFQHIKTLPLTELDASSLALLESWRKRAV